MKALPRLILVTAALCLALAFIWGSSGSSCMELLHQWHRREQIRRIATHSSDTLFLSLADYRSLTALDQHEICFGGRMYDITARRFSADSVVLSGHYDDFDRELFRLIDAFIGESSDAAHDQRRLQLFVFTGILPSAISIHPTTPSEATISHHHTASPAPDFPLVELPLPPPDWTRLS